MSTTYYEKYYKDLEGATIQKFVGMVGDDLEFGDGFPTFQVRFANGEVGQISISQDTEGNGGGFIFGLSIPESGE